MEVMKYRQYFLNRNCDYDEINKDDMDNIDVLGGHSYECTNKFMNDNYQTPFFIQSDGYISWDQSGKFKKYYSNDFPINRPQYMCLYNPILLSDFKLIMKYPGYTKFTQYCIGWKVNTIDKKKWYPVFSHERGKQVENINKYFKIAYQKYIIRMYGRILKQIFIDDLAYYIRDFIV
jgi:hypothetical protein